ncbi:hypothetical protein HYPSUDRAFT_313594 [Hypholoma sublateritium FD-334 SS-4]|uniref:Uncharacterized protein n=1 Tax=Hypholoma sublateritium (strain FD-334 SS-4) TaxID=945553 RepID=A0A0D2PCL9_HYPSF|nr:hypothetical protein HYPSUDRAFT_313594 [Hypholoma sublateritium FD-334 SS-4]
MMCHSLRSRSLISRFSPARPQEGLVLLDDSIAATSIAPKIGLIVAYDVLYIMGLATLLAVLATTYLSRRIKRTPLWFMSVSSWGVIGFANVLLVGQQTGPQPNLQFCLAQAALIYASPAFIYDSGILVSGTSVSIAEAESLPDIQCDAPCWSHSSIHCCHNGSFDSWIKSERFYPAR